MHILPDGQNITIDSEGQQLAEAILHPTMLKKDLPDLPAATVTQIMQHPDGATRKVSTVLWKNNDKIYLASCTLLIVFATNVWRTCKSLSARTFQPQKCSRTYTTQCLAAL